MSQGWVSCVSDGYRSDIARVARALGAEETLCVAESADDLREWVLSSSPGSLGVIVACDGDEVSDVNLAAAIAADGKAREVVLVRRGASGSLRSRAARARIDRVIDPNDLSDDSSQSRRPLRTEGARVVPGPPTVAQRGPVLVFASGRGGVGKTALAACTAAIAASWGMNVALLDLDLSCGNLFADFGLPRGLDLSRMSVEGLGDIARVGVSACEGVRLLGPCDLPEHAELASPLVGPLMASLASTSDLLVVDTSTTFTDATAQAVQMADRLLLVADGVPGSIASVARASGLAVRLGVARTRIARVENRVDPRGPADFSMVRAEVGLEGARVFKVAEGGGEVTDFLAAGRACDLVSLPGEFAESVGWTLAQVLVELGCLPESEEVSALAAQSEPWRRRALFGRRREAR